MKQETRVIQTLSVVALVGGLTSALSILLIGDTFGLPGSPGYQEYERFNRVMGLLLALESGVILAFYRQQRARLGRIGRFMVMLVFVAWIGMAAGTAAEFWLFSDLPYGADNLRSVAFSFFSLASLVVGLTLLVLGIRILVRRQIPALVGLLMLFYLPVDLAAFVADQSIFLASTLASIALALHLLRGRRDPVSRSGHDAL